MAWRWPLPQIMRWILGASTRWAVRRRFVGSLLLGYVILGTYEALAIWIISGQSFIGSAIRESGLREHIAYMWSQLPAVPLFIIFLVALQGVGLALQPRSWLTRGLFTLFKATLWRVVEYSKGAAAAVALLLTICFTVLKLVLS
jgi:hypothetical protein